MAALIASHTAGPHLIANYAAYPHQSKATNSLKTLYDTTDGSIPAYASCFMYVSLLITSPVFANLALSIYIIASKNGCDAAYLCL